MIGYDQLHVVLQRREAELSAANQRIKALEAERDGWREDANISRNSIAMLKDRCNYLEDTLAALQKRIDDAPVIAEVIDINPPKNGTSVIDAFLPLGTKLISKEDI